MHLIRNAALYMYEQAELHRQFFVALRNHLQSNVHPARQRQHLEALHAESMWLGTDVDIWVHTLTQRLHALNLLFDMGDTDFLIRALSDSTNAILYNVQYDR